MMMMPMGSSSHPVLRDRSNDDDIATKSLIRGFMDHGKRRGGGGATRRQQEAERKKATALRSSSPSCARTARAEQTKNTRSTSPVCNISCGNAVGGRADPAPASTACPYGKTTVFNKEPLRHSIDTSAGVVADEANRSCSAAVGVEQQQQQPSPPVEEDGEPTQTVAREDDRRHYDYAHTNTNTNTNTEHQPRPPRPPVACTLVAFEPGSLGLELEAIVDEEAKRRTRKKEEETTTQSQGGQEERPQQQHEQHHRQQRRRHRRRPTRLGCRVFRVTPEGQAARHGSIHPGDALVVLDGVDVLSAPFDDITRALLDRQGRRRLLGFMGAAAVGAAAAATATTTPVLASREHPSAQPPSSPISPILPLTASDNATAPAAAAAGPSAAPKAASPSDPSVTPRTRPCRGTTDSAGTPATEKAVSPVGGAKADFTGGWPPDADGEKGGTKRGEERGHRRQRARSGEGVVRVAARSQKDHERGGGECGGVGASGSSLTATGGRCLGERVNGQRSGEGHAGEKEIAAAAAAATAVSSASAAASSHSRPRSRSSSLALSMPEPKPGVLDLRREFRGAERIPHPRTTRRQFLQTANATAGAAPAAFQSDDGSRGGSGHDDERCGARHFEGSNEPAEAELRQPIATAPPTSRTRGTDGVQPATLPRGVGRAQRRGRSEIRRTHGNSSVRIVGESLGSSWGSSRASMPTHGFAAGSRHRQGNAWPLDGSRGESLQRSLVEAMKDKSELAEERAWLLEEVQRAREATLERDGVIAGQEVEADVLRMEVGALERELRRARQELGACEAGRRELNEAVKRDLARRDRETADLSSALHRERAARDRDSDKAAAAAAAAAARAADKATAVGRVAVKDARRRAENAEARAAEAEARVEAVEEAARAEAAEVAAEAAESLRRERERREMEVREREEEISALLLRVRAAESRTRRTNQDKEERLREVQDAAALSVEAAEGRRAEWEEKASAMAMKLRERDAEDARKDHIVKELEARLERANVRASDMEERDGNELRVVKEELAVVRKVLGDREALARGEADRLAHRLRDEEHKVSDTVAKLRTLEQRARFMETSAAAARQRADASARKEHDLSERLAEVEMDGACQKVELTTLKAQLEELRRGAAAGDTALREAVKLKKMLKEMLRSTADSNLPSGPDPAATTVIAGSHATVVPATPVEGVEDEQPRRRGSGVSDGGVLAGSLVELVEQLKRQMESLDRELTSAREALSKSRDEIKALKGREKDAAELRSLLEQKRGISKQLARGAEAARLRAEKAEGEAEKMRADTLSLRSEAEAARQQAEEKEERLNGQQANITELRAKNDALAERLSDAEAAAARARADLSVAAKEASSLENALDAAELEKAEVTRRLTRQGADSVELQSRLEGTSAELEVVKAALLEGCDKRVSRQRKACVALDGVLSRSRARSAAETMAFLRWRRATTATKTLPAEPRRQHPLAELCENRVSGRTGNMRSGGGMGKENSVGGRTDAAPALAGRVIGGGNGVVVARALGKSKAPADSPLPGFGEQVAAAKAAAATAREETQVLKKEHAHALEESRLARSELASVHLRTRMCGGRILSGVLQKWTWRQSARAFWRLRTGVTAASAATSVGGGSPSYVPHDATGGSEDTICEEYNSSSMANKLLTVKAPTPLGASGGGEGGCGSPRSDDAGGVSLERRRRALSARSNIGPKSSTPSSSQLDPDRQGSGDGSGGGGGGGGGCFLPTGTTVPAPYSSPPQDGSNVGFFYIEGSGSGGTALTQENCRRRKNSKGRAVDSESGMHYLPPTSPASSWVRNQSPSGEDVSFGMDHGVGDDGGGGDDLLRAVKNNAAAVGGGAVVTSPISCVSLSCDDNDRSFFSSTLSEPRYEFLQSGSSSPAWSCMGSRIDADGSAGGMLPLEVSDESSGEGGGHGRGGRCPKVMAHDKRSGEPTVSSDDGRSAEGVARGGGNVTGEEETDLGREVDVVLGGGDGGDLDEGGEDSWWALSDDE